MANQLIYKDIGVGGETSWGASIACSSVRLHVKTCTLNHLAVKEVVDDTTMTPLGSDRIVRVRNEDTGDITGYHTPRTMHYMWELAMGTRGSSAAAGSSGVLMTYYQSVGGSYVSDSINIDRNSTQETFNGVRVTALEITGSDNKIEFTANCLAKTYSTNGTSMQDLVGETIKVANFADTTITIHNGATYGAQLTTPKVSEWSVKYDNKSEGEYQSGSRDLSRSDPLLPEVTGKFKIFHEGLSFVRLADGCSEAYIRFNIVYPSCAGLVNGVTSYIERIDVPRTEITSNVRNYEAAQKSVEEVEFMGKFDTGLSALIRVTQTLAKADVD